MTADPAPQPLQRATRMSMVRSTGSRWSATTCGWSFHRPRDREVRRSTASPLDDHGRRPLLD
jgi:hypothetical protein